MMISITVLLISFLLDGLLSNIIPIFFNNSSLLIPMFSITSLILIYPYFNNDDSNYFKLIAIFGLLYDIIFSNTLFFNMSIFLLIGLLIKIINYYFSNNVITVIFMSALVTISYHFINFILLSLIKYNTLNFYDLFYAISHSLILNIIFVSIGLLILNKLSKVYNIKKSD